MLRSYVRTALVCIIGVCAVSCVSMTIEDVGKLRKGMPVAEAKAALPVAPDREYEVTVSDGDALVCQYTLVSGGYSSDYFLAFVEDQLLFWGYPHEFARSSTKLIRDVGEAAVKMGSADD